MAETFCWTDPIDGRSFDPRRSHDIRLRPGTYTVLIEHEGRDPGQVRGRTRRNKVVVFDGDPARIGAYTHARLERTTGATFAGSEVEASQLAAAGV